MPLLPFPCFWRPSCQCRKKSKNSFGVKVLRFHFLIDIYLFKVNNGNSKICVSSKLATETPERPHTVTSCISEYSSRSTDFQVDNMLELDLFRSSGIQKLFSGLLHEYNLFCDDNLIWLIYHINVIFFNFFMNYVPVV